jgi:hypothetical protein
MLRLGVRARGRTTATAEARFRTRITASVSVPALHTPASDDLQRSRPPRSGSRFARDEREQAQAVVGQCQDGWYQQWRIMVLLVLDQPNANMPPDAAGKWSDDQWRLRRVVDGERVLPDAVIGREVDALRGHVVDVHLPEEEADVGHVRRIGTYAIRGHVRPFGSVLTLHAA